MRGASLPAVLASVLFPCAAWCQQLGITDILDRFAVPFLEGNVLETAGFTIKLDERPNAGVTRPNCTRYFGPSDYSITQCELADTRILIAVLLLSDRSIDLNNVETTVPSEVTLAAGQVSIDAFEAWASSNPNLEEYAFCKETEQETPLKKTYLFNEAFIYKTDAKASGVISVSFSREQISYVEPEQGYNYVIALSAAIGPQVQCLTQG